MGLANPGDSDLRTGDSGNGYAKAHWLTRLTAWILIRDGCTLVGSPCWVILFECLARAAQAPQLAMRAVVIVSSGHLY